MKKSIIIILLVICTISVSRAQASHLDYCEEIKNKIQSANNLSEYEIQGEGDSCSKMSIANISDNIISINISGELTKEVKDIEIYYFIIAHEIAHNILDKQHFAGEKLETACDLKSMELVENTIGAEDMKKYLGYYLSFTKNCAHKACDGPRIRVKNSIEDYAQKKGYTLKVKNND